jgi:hypothetical protein
MAKRSFLDPIAAEHERDDVYQVNVGAQRLGLRLGRGDRGSARER